MKYLTVVSLFGRSATLVLGHEKAQVAMLYIAAGKIASLPSTFAVSPANAAMGGTSEGSEAPDCGRHQRETTTSKIMFQHVAFSDQSASC